MGSAKNTSDHESTESYVYKLVTFIALLLFLWLVFPRIIPWINDQLIDFSEQNAERLRQEIESKSQ